MRHKKLLVAVLAIALFLIPSVPMATAAKPTCTTIQDGILTYSPGRYLEGQPLMLGYDPYGYNYQAHIFRGYYCNYYLNVLDLPPYEGDDTAYYQRLVDEDMFDTVEEAETYMNSIGWLWDPRNAWLVMKWNDAWLSNKDCDGDDLLDRHYGFGSYIGSGAWDTNHLYSTNANGKKYTSFVKIVAVPADATLVDSVWYTAGGVEIGETIWGQFAIIFEVINDPETGEHGLQINPQAPAGFGYYK